MIPRGAAATLPPADARPTPPMRPLVTIIIPTCNRAHLVGRAIESVLAQRSAPDFADLGARTEVLVADDASEDATPALLEHMAARHPGLRVMRHPRRLGVNGNYTAALRASRGRFVAILSDDDVYHPEMNVRRLRRLAARPGSALCYTAHRDVTLDAAGRAAGHRDVLPHEHSRDESRVEFVHRMVVTGRTHTWNTVMFRGAAARASLPLLATTQPEADVEFQLRVAARFGGASYVPDVLLTRYHHAGNYYRLHQGGAGRDAADQQARRACRLEVLGFARDYRRAVLELLAATDPATRPLIGPLMRAHGRSFGWSRVRIGAAQVARGRVRDASETLREAELVSDDAAVMLASRVLRGACGLLRLVV